MTARAPLCSSIYTLKPPDGTFNKRCRNMRWFQRSDMFLWQMLPQLWRRVGAIYRKDWGRLRWNMRSMAELPLRLGPCGRPGSGIFLLLQLRRRVGAKHRKGCRNMRWFLRSDMFLWQMLPQARSCCVRVGAMHRIDWECLVARRTEMSRSATETWRLTAF